MKKIWMVVSCCAFIAACSNSENSENAEYEAYYESNGEAPVYADSTSEAELSASTRQSEVDTNLNNIGTDRTDVPATAATTTSTATTGGAASTTGTAANTGAAAATAGTTAAAQQNFDKGKNLIATSDCLACHQVDSKLVGPAYVEVAKKYEFNDKNVDYLAGKIIDGGAGVWGQIPMSPHPDLSRENAKEMAKYILSLNK